MRQPAPGKQILKTPTGEKMGHCGEKRNIGKADDYRRAIGHQREPPHYLPPQVLLHVNLKLEVFDTSN